MIPSTARTRRRPGPYNQAEQAYSQVRNLLVAGKFQPGDRLNEMDLSVALSMSRTPIREALRRLQSDGLVAPTGRGVVVASLSAEDTRHALEVQGALESLAAELAATRQRDGMLAPAEIHKLLAAATEVEELSATGDVPGVWRANLRFHQLIAELGGNPLLVESLDRIWIKFAIVTLHNLRGRPRLTPPHTHHRVVLDAIVNGDPAGAAAAARAHSREGTAHYLASLAEPQVEPPVQP
jgi:DNA-binding GntR family transcriptional regulator